VEPGVEVQSRCVGEAPPDVLPAAPASGPAWDSLDAWLFPPRDPRSERDRVGVRTDGVLVVHDGVVVHERYGPGWDAGRRHLAWSASKSFANALAGIATLEGFDLDRSICEYRAASRPEACVLTPRHLLSFSSGLDWHETYEGEPPTTSSVLAMLYGHGHDDVYAFVTAHRFRDPPGTSWQYSSGDTNVLTGAVGAFLEPRHGADWPHEVLFRRIGMRDVTFERDGAGTYVGSSYVWAPPRDLARFGLLLAADGCWGADQVLPAGWVAWSTEVEPAMGRKVVGWEAGDVQGRQFWLNRVVPGLQETLPWEGVPDDAFAAMGHWKQSITVIPSRGLVVVRVADDRDGTFTHAELLRRVLAAVEAQ
jgi:CubicO group peptidase (beta-lactamase class C family)